jgi:hypothetical protein
MFWNGTAWVDLDREVKGLNTATTTIRFNAQADIPNGSVNSNHYLYYGAPSASAAPANLDHIYLFRDDFEAGLGNWTVVSGLWQTSTAKAHGGTTALMYPPEDSSSDLSTNIVGPSTLNEGDVMFEAWWNLQTSVTGFDIAQGVRQQPGNAVNRYEVNCEQDPDEGFTGAAVIADQWNQLGTFLLGTPVADTWMKIGVAVVGTEMRIFKDDVQIIPDGTGSQPVGADFKSGTVGFRKWIVPPSVNWWVDDVTLRRYTFPEPTVAAGAAETKL